MFFCYVSFSTILRHVFFNLPQCKGEFLNSLQRESVFCGLIAMRGYTFWTYCNVRGCFLMKRMSLSRSTVLRFLLFIFLTKRFLSLFIITKLLPISFGMSRFCCRRMYSGSELRTFLFVLDQKILDYIVLLWIYLFSCWFSSLFLKFFDSISGFEAKEIFTIFFIGPKKLRNCVRFPGTTPCK